MGHRSWFTIVNTKKSAKVAELIINENFNEKTKVFPYDGWTCVSYFAKCIKEIIPFKENDLVLAWNTDSSAVIHYLPEDVWCTTFLLDELEDERIRGDNLTDFFEFVEKDEFLKSISKITLRKELK